MWGNVEQVPTGKDFRVLQSVAVVTSYKQLKPNSEEYSPARSPEGLDEFELQRNRGYAFRYA